MNILITTTAFTALFCGAAFAQSSDIAHEAHRFVNNASAVSHVNSSTHENLPDRVNKNNTPSFSEMNEHERAIVAHSFMNIKKCCPAVMQIQRPRLLLLTN